MTTGPFFAGWSWQQENRVTWHGAAPGSVEDLKFPKPVAWGEYSPEAQRLAHALLSRMMDTPPWDLVDALVEERIQWWSKGDGWEMTEEQLREWIEEKTREAKGE